MLNNKISHIEFNNDVKTKFYNTSFNNMNVKNSSML